MGFTGRFGFPVYGPRQYVTCGYQDNLGFGYNTALGVKVANPDKAVVSISGDGGFMFGVQELSTAVHHGINVVAIVFNNSSFGNVLRDQRQVYQGRYIGADLTNPDFVRLGRELRRSIPAEQRPRPSCAGCSRRRFPSMCPRSSKSRSRKEARRAPGRSSIPPRQRHEPDVPAARGA